MKLIDVREGTSCRLKDVGGREYFLSRAASFGLVAGTELDVVRNQKKMPLLIYARDTLIAVNQKDSMEIEVEVCTK